MPSAASAGERSGPRAVSVAANSRWNLLALGFTLGAHFITVPFVIGRIGLAEFGHAGLVLAAWAPLLLVGTVIGQATTREMAERIGAGDTPGAERVAAAALHLCALACLVGGVAFALLGPLLMAWLTESNRALGDWRREFAIAGLGWAAQQFALVLQGTVAARQDYRSIARISAASAVATVASTLAITAAVPSASGYLGGVSFGFVATALVCAVLTRRAATGVQLSLRRHTHELGLLLRFGKWQTVAQLAGTLSNQIDRYVLGALAPAAVVGQYNAANRLQEAAYVGVIKAAEVLFPRFGAMAQADPAVRARFYLVASWVVMIFSMAVLAPLIPLAEPLLRLWAGAEVADGGATLLRTLVLGGLVGCGSNVFTYYLMGTGQNAPVAALAVIYSVLTIVFTVVLLNVYGAMAAGAGLALASVARVALALVFARKRVFSLVPWSPLLISSMLPLGVGIGLAGAATAWAAPGRIDNWPVLAVAYIAMALAVALAGLAATALTAFGRGLVRELAHAGRGP